MLDPRLRFGLPFEQQFRDFDDYVKKSGFISVSRLEYAAQHLEMLDVLIGVRSERNRGNMFYVRNREYHPNIPRKRYTDKNKILQSFKVGSKLIVAIIQVGWGRHDYLVKAYYHL